MRQARDLRQISLMRRWWRHLSLTRWQVRRVMTEPVLQAITEAVRVSERQHGGEIRVALEGDWPLSELWRGMSVRQRALDVFAQLRVWDTDARNGVLLYLSLADRQVEIVADRGLDNRVSAAEWVSICAQIESSCAQAAYQVAICTAVTSIGVLLARHFPQADRNELPDRPTLL